MITEEKEEINGELIEDSSPTIAPSKEEEADKPELTSKPEATEAQGWDVPTDDAPDEDWAKFREGLRPSKAEEYDFGEHKEGNPEILNKYKEIFWESGVPNRMAKELLERIGKHELEYTQGQINNLKNIVQKAEEDLGKEYEGGTKRINQILMDKLTEDYGAEDAKGVFESMTGNIAVKKVLLDHILQAKGRGFVKGDTASQEPSENRLRNLRQDDKFMAIARDKSHRDYNKHNDIIAELAYDIAMEKEENKKEK
jgi:hypothetical protein